MVDSHGTLGFPELRVLFHHELSKIDLDARLMIIQTLTITILSVYFEAHPSTFLGASLKCAKQGMFFKMRDIKKIDINKNGDWEIVLQLRYFKNHAGEAHSQEENIEYTLRSVKQIENILFDPCALLLSSLILRGHIEGISSIEELKHTQSEELHIKPSSADLPVFSSGKERGRLSANEEKVMMSANFCTNLVDLGEKIGLGRVSTHDFCWKGGVEMARIIKVEMDKLPTYDKSKMHHVFHNHYSHLSKCHDVSTFSGLWQEDLETLITKTRTVTAVRAVACGSVYDVIVAKDGSKSGSVSSRGLPKEYKDKVENLPVIQDLRECLNESWKKLKSHYHPSAFDGLSESKIPSQREISKREPLITNEVFEMDLVAFNCAVSRIGDCQREKRRKETKDLRRKDDTDKCGKSTSDALKPILGKESSTLDSDVLHETLEGNRKAQKKSLANGKTASSSSHEYDEDESISLEAFKDDNEPLAFECVDMFFAKICLMIHLEAPVVIVNAIENLRIVNDGKFLCDICAAWPEDIPLPPKFTQATFDQKGNMLRHRREMHNAWTDFAFQMIKDVPPGIFRCPEGDFEAASITDVSQHMLKGCRMMEHFSKVFPASCTSRRKAKEPEEVDDFVEFFRKLRNGDVPPPAPRISSSALKTFGSLSMDDFKFLNAKFGFTPTNVEVKGFKIIAGSLGRLHMKGQL